MEKRKMHIDNREAHEIIMSAINYDDGGNGVSFYEYLEQALTRPSFANKYGIPYNSEILEFYGDSFLNTIVSMEMAKHYRLEPGIDSIYDYEYWMYNSVYKEEELTRIRSSIVCKDNLAKRCDELGISEYILCDDADLDVNGYPQKSCKEDTFEAIIGAVAMDCNFNFKEIREVVITMLDLNSFFNKKEYYVDKEKIVNDYYKLKYKHIPHLKFEEEDNGWSAYVDEMLDGSYGRSKREARLEMYEKIYDELSKNKAFISLESMVGEFTLEDCLQQAKILSDKKIFRYEYKYKKERRDGTDLWICYLFVYYSETNLTKESTKPITRCLVIESSQNLSKKISRVEATYFMLLKFNKIYCELLTNGTSGSYYKNIVEMDEKARLLYLEGDFDE